MTGWLIISSKQNYDISRGLNFSIQGLKKRHKKKALEIEPEDIFFYYITGIQRLAAAVQIRSQVETASEMIWVNLGKDPSECYPWRFQTTPHIILPEEAWIPMVSFSKTLLHFKKWPEKNWRLGLQGQLHHLRDEDTRLLLDSLHARQSSP